MLFKPISFFYFILIFGFFSCISNYKVTDPGGVNSKIVMSTKYSIKAELLFLSEDTLFAYSKGTLYGIHLNNIKKIQGYDLEADGRNTILILSGISGLVLTSQLEQVGWQIPMIGLSLFGIFQGIDGTHRTRIKQPFSLKQKQKISLYCRYPQGLTREQYNFLMTEYTISKPAIILGF